MRANIFSAAGQAAHLGRLLQLNGAKSAIFAGFEGVPAKQISDKHNPRKADYILHTDCIDGLHRTAFEFIIFYRRRRTVLCRRIWFILNAKEKMEERSQ